MLILDFRQFPEQVLILSIDVMYMIGKNGDSSMEDIA